MSGTVRRSAMWLLVALPLLLALVIYHPYRALPLDVWDFREFLPILDRTPGAWSRFAALVAYYSHDGRMNPLLYATFVLQYNWFGVDSLGWQWFRFIWMALDTVLVVMVARRMGLRLVAGVAAAALLVTAVSAVRGWVLLMAEPQALAAILGAVYLALNYQRTSHWPREATAITMLVIVVFLSKEIIGSLGMMVLLLAVFWQQPMAGKTIWSRRNVVLAVLLALVAAGEVILLLVVRAQPESTGYGMAYGSAPISIEHFFANVLAILLPVRYSADVRLGLLYPGNVLPILALALGLTASIRRGLPHRRLLLVIVLGTLPALIGAAVYLPWPKFENFYGLPFFVGPLLLYAAALDRLLDDSGIRRKFAFVVAIAVPFYGAIAASRSVEAHGALLSLHADLARLIGRFAPGDSVLILSPPAGPHALPVSAEELRDYAAALGWLDTTRSAAILGVPCSRFTPNSGLHVPGVAYVTYSYGCGRMPNPVVRLASTYTWHDWQTFASIRDTMTVDLSGAAVEMLLPARAAPARVESPPPPTGPAAPHATRP